MMEEFTTKSFPLTLKHISLKRVQNMATDLTLMSALYFFPLTMPSRVGVWLSLKLRVTSYTAFTEKQNKTSLNPGIRAERG